MYTRIRERHLMFFGPRRLKYIHRNSVVTLQNLRKQLSLNYHHVLS